MSWKGFTKAVNRLPQRVLQKAGYAEETHDPDFEQIEILFKDFESAAKKLQEDTKAFQRAVQGLLNHQAAIGTSFEQVFAPVSSRVGAAAASSAEQSPQLASTSVNAQSIASYVGVSKDWNERQLQIMLDSLEAVVVKPCEELMEIVKAARSTIDKRNRKHVDYDRYYTALKKAQEKENSNPSDMLRAEQNYNEAKAQYDYYNELCKNEVPLLYDMRVAFMDPVIEMLVRFQFGFFNDITNLMYPMSNELDLGDPALEDTYKDSMAPVLESMVDIRIFNARIIDPSLPVAVPLPGTPGGPPGPTGGAGSPPGSPTGASSKADSFGPPPTGGASGFGAPPAAGAAGFSAPPAARSSPAIPSSIPPSLPRSPTARASDVICYAHAAYDYQSDTPGDLSFTSGQRIAIIKRTPSQEDWWTGRLDNGQSGIFPANYVVLE
ncbi:hypothetical protein H696_00720 [Fonticula alba]|uniref:BAR domain-containing protein n=1 Tax=Fonticula alba TaxID=691883 RepID=A0A058ZI27_FONAL|nr:hypothetical protein H696_00720 [Fonticula alba]KCV73177.1 hypothetical protein H696_00720 [Fonticula alba]|eukprot:XP_009492878.1 hypothetical protein H696_00720 [Fonticula alba]